MRPRLLSPTVTATFCTIAFGYPTTILLLLIVRSVSITQSSSDSYGCFIDEGLWGWRLAAVYVPLWLSMLVVLLSSAFTLHELTSLLALCNDSQELHNVRRLRRKVMTSATAYPPLTLRVPHGARR